MAVSLKCPSMTFPDCFELSGREMRSDSFESQLYSLEVTVIAEGV